MAIARDASGALIALRSGRPVDPGAVWTWCCRHPVSEQAYRAVVERGEPWPEDLPGLGHNSRGHVDRDLEEAGRDHGAAELLGAIEALWRQARAWLDAIGSVATRAQADRLANFADALAQLEKQAEDARTRQKKPVLEEGRAVDERWKPVVETAGEAKAALKKALTPWLVEEQDRLASRSSGTGRVVPARAGTGARRIGLREVRRLEVTDRSVLLAHYQGDGRLWAHEEVMRRVFALAEADLAAGLLVPGAVLSHEMTAV